MRNKNGSVLMYGLMLSLVIIVLGLALAEPVSDFVSDARGADGLNCTNPGIGIYDEATCVVADLSIFYFIGGIILIAGAIAISRIVFGGSQ